MVRRVRPVLEDLSTETGETVSLALVKTASLRYVDHISVIGATFAPWTEERVSLHSTSSGKIFLAWLSEAEREGALPSTLERFTESTTVDRRGAGDRAGRSAAARLRLLSRRGRRAHQRGLGRGAGRATASDRGRQHLGAGATHSEPIASRAGARRCADGRTRGSVAGMTLPDWQSGPANRWAFQHVDEIVPCLPMSRGSGPVLELNEAPQPLGDWVDAFVEESYTDGIIVLRGRDVLVRALPERHDADDQAPAAVGVEVAHVRRLRSVRRGRIGARRRARLDLRP